MNNPLDPICFPHLLDLILSHLGRNEGLVLRNVSHALRNHVDPRLFKHLVVRSFNWDHPVSLHSTEGLVPVPWKMNCGSDNKSIAAQQAILGQMRKYCVVMDVSNHEPFSSQDYQRRAAFADLRSLPNLHTVRRFTPAAFQPAVHTIIDFAVVDKIGAKRPPIMMCKRYVVPNLAIQECLDEVYSNHYISNSDIDSNGFHFDGTQILEDVVLEGLSGVEEVVLIFRDWTRMTYVADFLERNVGLLPTVNFTFVGVVDASPMLHTFSIHTANAPSVNTGEDLEQRLEEHMDRISCDPDIVRRSVTFMSTSEYLEEVGSERVSLETSPAEGPTEGVW